MSITAEQLRAELAKPGRSQAALGRHMGRGSTIINKLVNGKRDLKAREIEQIMDYLSATEADTVAAAAPSILIERMTERLAATSQTARGVSIRAGLSPDAVRMILSGRSVSPRGETLSALARELACDVRYLLGETDKRGVEPKHIRIASQCDAQDNAVRNNWMPDTNLSTAPIHMTVSADGLAHLRMDMKLPLDVAVEILALVQGKTDE